MKASFLSALLAAGIVSACSQKSGSTEISTAVAEYPKFHRMMPEWKWVGRALTVECAPAAAAPGNDLPKKLGPHYGSYIQHYRNEVAYRAAEGPEWPVGSILVKEKWAAKSATAGPGEAVPEGITGMIKRERGTKPDSGDWEFFAAENGKIATAGTGACAGCHSAATRDFVFSKFPAAPE
jgi:hypothetical protein